MKGKAEDYSISLEIRVAGKNGPVAGASNRTDEHVHCRHSQSFTSTLIAEQCRRFVVGSGDQFVWECAEDFLQLMELGLRFDSGKKLLADDADDFRTPLVDEFGQFGNLLFFGGIQMAQGTAKRQRPYRSIYEDIHERFLERSRLWL